MINYLAQISIFVSIFLILSISMNLVLGYGGVFSLAPAAFYGIGAYFVAQLAIHWKVAFPLDLLAAFVGTACIAGLLSPILIRLKEDYLIIGTLALQLVLSNVFMGWNGATGGSYGIFGIPKPALLGMVFTSVGSYAILAGVVAVIVLAISLYLARSIFGLRLRGQREDPLLAASFGLNSESARIAIFILGSGLAAVAGGLYARFIGYIDPSSFDISQSLSIITIVVIGGLSNLWGTLVAAAGLELIPQLLNLIPGTSDRVAQIQLLLYGLILLVVVRFRPQGLIPERPQVFAGKRSDPRVAAEIGDFEDPESLSGSMEHLTVSPPRSTPPLIEVRDLAKRFGGIKAVDGTSLRIEPGRVTALIGPNGAGKTTLFNLICGYLKPDRGQVLVGGSDWTGRAPSELARLGIARTFQDVRIFPRLTVLENLVFALSGVASVQSQAGWPQLVRQSLEILDQFQLSAHADHPAGKLSYAQQKLLMMAAVVGRGDPVLFLDEIAAGLDTRSIRGFASLIRRIAESGRTVCLVEHNLTFVWDTADAVAVLNEGRLLVFGTAEEIRHNRLVGEIYFGTANKAASS